MSKHWKILSDEHGPYGEICECPINYDHHEGTPMTTHEPARLLVEVTAGVIPQKPDPEHTKLYAITAAEWAAAGEAGTQSRLLAEVNGRAQGYAALLMLQPDALNWVRTDWIWL